VGLCAADPERLTGRSRGALALHSSYDILASPMEHELWMRAALEEAQAAVQAGEIPVGAVVVWENQIIGRGRNRRETLKDPTAHAEVLALREAAQVRGGWRLSGATLYCTLEPCPMCAGALVNARIEALVYGLRDPKAGAAGSVYDLVRSPWLNHRLRVTSGVLADEVEALMQAFFAALRGREPGQ
jgi:tRNA(adenine34) deaminase